MIRQTLFLFHPFRSIDDSILISLGAIIIIDYHLIKKHFKILSIRNLRKEILSTVHLLE